MIYKYIVKMLKNLKLKYNKGNKSTQFFVYLKYERK